MPLLALLALLLPLMRLRPAPSRRASWRAADGTTAHPGGVEVVAPAAGVAPALTAPRPAAATLAGGLPEVPRLDEAWTAAGASEGFAEPRADFPNPTAGGPENAAAAGQQPGLSTSGATQPSDEGSVAAPDADPRVRAQAHAVVARRRALGDESGDAAPVDDRPEVEDAQAGDDGTTPRP